MHDWWWHLVNDPMRDNPYSIAAAFLIGPGSLALAFWVTGRRHR